MVQSTLCYLGTQLPSPKRGQSPNFWPIFIVVKRLDASRCHLILDLGLSPGDFVLDGDPAPTPKGAEPPQFSDDVYCGQTASWIKMPIGTELGLGTCHIVLDGDPAPQKSGHSPQFSAYVIFGPCLLWPHGSVNQDTTWYGGRPQPRRHCVRWGTAFPIFGQCLLWPSALVD